MILYLTIGFIISLIIISIYIFCLYKDNKLTTDKILPLVGSGTVTMFIWPITILVIIYLMGGYCVAAVYDRVSRM